MHLTPNVICRSNRHPYIWALGKHFNDCMSSSLTCSSWSFVSDLSIQTVRSPAVEGCHPHAALMQTLHNSTHHQKADEHIPVAGWVTEIQQCTGQHHQGFRQCSALRSEDNSSGRKRRWKFIANLYYHRNASILKDGADSTTPAISVRSKTESCFSVSLQDIQWKYVLQQTRHDNLKGQ
jgi:hypothetical protein